MKKFLIFLISIALCFSVGMTKPKDSLENALYSHLLSAAFGQATSNYMAPGGGRWVIRGELEIDSTGGFIDIETGGALKLNGTDITTQLGYLSGVTLGTVTASKFVAVDANKDISIFRYLSGVGLYAGASGTAGSVRVYPTTASKGYFAFSCTDQTGNTAATITADAMGQATTLHWADPGGATSYLVQSTAALTLAEVDVLDAVTPGTAAASKAVVLGASKEISTITTAGITTANIGTGNFSTALNSTVKTSIDFDDTADGIVDVIDLSHTSSDDNATALDGIGISFELENATGTSTVEEYGSIDHVSTTITDGSEDSDFVFSQMLAGTVTEAFRSDSSDQSFTIGRNATDANGMYQLRMLPLTASRGSFRIQATANTGDTDLTITNAAQGQATILTIPDGGSATANFLLSQGAQTVVGAQTFTNLFSVDQDDVNDGIRNNITLSHTSSDDNATAADGVGISIELENATGTSTVEEWFSLDFLSTTITDGSEDGDIVFNAMLGGTVSPALTIDASDQSLTLGANVTDADGIHQLRIFPVATATGSLLIDSIANSGDFVVSLQNAAHGQATAYTLPDIGQATGNIVTLKASQTTAGELKRADLTEEALAVYGISINDFRAADGAVLAITESAGDHYFALGTNTITLKSEVANNNTKTDISYTQFVLPPEYVAAGDVKIRVKHTVSGAGTSNNSTVDFSVYEQTGNGAVGADLVTTAATVTTEDSWTTTDFTVTSAGLVAGDILIIKFTTAVIESATANIDGEYDGFAVLLDIKG